MGLFQPDAGYGSGDGEGGVKSIRFAAELKARPAMGRAFKEQVY